jgi:hypothetical protein
LKDQFNWIAIESVQRKYNAMEFELILAVLLGTPQGIQK